MSELEWSNATELNYGKKLKYITQVEQQGFRIRFQRYCERTIDLRVEVTQENALVAWAEVTEDEHYLVCQDISVSCSFQRRGIGTAIFVVAETLFGKPLENLWSDIVSKSKIRGFWDRPDRPFGTSPSQ